MEILFKSFVILAWLYLCAMYFFPKFFAGIFSTHTLETIEEWTLKQIVFFCGELFFIVLLLIGLTTSQWVLFLSVLLLRILSDHSIQSTLRLYALVSWVIFSGIVNDMIMPKPLVSIAREFILNLIN
jgi:hypothetical protein